MLHDHIYLLKRNIHVYKLSYTHFLGLLSDFCKRKSSKMNFEALNLIEINSEFLKIKHK